jgi:sulfate adenylyltransferase large subunit
LLTDGLRAEREQGITIDVAYRYFSTSKRKLIIADTPGHEQYTRNMATGASTADQAVILIGAEEGITDQTRRHTYIATLLGIGQLAVTVNKMDLVDWSEDRFDAIISEYQALLTALPYGLDTHFIPVSALTGDNVVDKSSNVAWFDGRTLMEHLESTPIGGSLTKSDPAKQPLRFPVQLAVRPGPEFRGFAGTIESGTLAPGDMIRVEPSGITTTIDHLVTFDGDLDQAVPGQAVTITTSTEVDIGRGDVVVDVGHPLKRSHTLDVGAFWLSAQPLKVGTDLLVQHSHRLLNAKVTTVRETIDVTTLRAVPSSPDTELELNAIAHVVLRTDAE